MASSNKKNGYPPRFYDEGKIPTQIKSMNYNCYLSNFQMVKESVGNDVWIDLKNSSLGVILKLKEMDYIWSSKVVHYFLTHQLVIKRSNEIWSLIDDRPIRFSLFEFAEITGLNCSSFDSEDIIGIDHKEFWLEMNISPSEGPTFEELEKLFPICRNWSFEKRRMIGMLCILSIGIYGRSPASRIPLDAAKRVLDIENFEKHPWGRVAFKSLVDSIKVVSYEGKKTYTLQGFVHALLIWVYESVPGIGELYGNRVAGNDIPIISWKGSRKRIKYDLFVEQEKKLYEKVRVRHMIVKPENEIYPQWDDDNDDEELNNMILDILNNCLDASAWDVSNGKVIGTSTKKRIDRVSETYVSEQCLKKNKEDLKLPTQQSTPTVVDNTKLNYVGEMTLLSLIAEVKVLTTTVNGIDAIIADKVATSINVREAELLKKIAILEAEVKCLKEKLEINVKEAANSNADLNDDATSNGMSWMVQTKATSEENLPIKCVVRNVQKQPTKIALEKQSTRNNSVVLKKVKIEGVKANLAEDKKEGKKVCINSVETLSDSWSDPVERERHMKFSAALDKMAEGIAKLDDQVILGKRKAKLTKSQVWPYIGHPTVKRIITGVTPSSATYDPFAVVDSDKLDKLEKFMENDIDEPLATCDSSVEFYKKIITPREQWEPKEDYGWLGDSHITSAMHMLHKRSMRDPSPFCSSKIAFLNHWFVKSWVKDYKNYNSKTWDFPEKYIKVFNGEYPAEFVTNKKWLIDIEHLYFCHHINGNHWVALDVDLVKEHIHVYDSIQSLVKDDKELFNECKAFTKMIPALLNKMVPSTLRKKSEKQFTIRRLKNAPQNDNPGDCGVYSIKYIECLAIGCTFEGLSDRNIHQLRLKLAAEIFDEIAII